MRRLQPTDRTKLRRLAKSGPDRTLINRVLRQGLVETTAEPVSDRAAVRRALRRQQRRASQDKDAEILALKVELLCAMTLLQQLAGKTNRMDRENNMIVPEFPDLAPEWVEAQIHRLGLD